MPTHDELFDRASRYLPGGVSAAARARVALGRPLYIARGDGAKLYDVEGNEYLDLSTSHGASLLGHNHPRIGEAVQKALDMGTICSMDTEHHGALAEKICELVPCMEMVRFAGSGTETTMHCIRVAREHTGKNVIVKFEGHFHGIHDYLQYNWPSTNVERTPGRPGPLRCESGGVPDAMGQFVIVLPFNDREVLTHVFAERANEIAAVILEPIAYNAGCILPRPGYLELLREECTKHGVVLIFDEILSGFRTGTDCAQGYLGVTPDLCTLGKSLGGGAPISAFGGRRDIMQVVSPLGASSHSGTYNGHLYQVLPALAALKEYSQPGFYDNIHALAGKLYDGTNALFERSKLKARLQGVGARFGLFFGIEGEVWDGAGASKNDRALVGKFRDACFRRGIYMDTNGHAGFSSKHTPADIDRVLSVFADAVGEVEKEIS
ncbi:MAG: aminotransferase class III-fold pyridoxal phosphate-dependent enzyme [Planctomycetes bacterium]|nr:aminotransferase class III-fold pyridoxal phosphate-dependent enzyme [Planctomycetota bacterium]